MIKILVFSFLVLGIFLSWSNVSHAQCFPGEDYQRCFERMNGPGAGLTGPTLTDLLENIGGFLIAAAGIIAGIVIIVAGIMYMASGSNTARTATAKAIFKNGVIGALIIFAAGIIINTIVIIASDWRSFFG